MQYIIKESFQKKGDKNTSFCMGKLYIWKSKIKFYMD